MGINKVLIHRKNNSNGVVETVTSPIPHEEYQHQLIITRAEKEIIDRIRAHPGLSKSELVAYTEYSRTKISGCVDNLLQRNYIIENEETEYSGGRRSRTYSINGRFGFLAGVDIGATSIDIAIADLSEKFLFAMLNLLKFVRAPSRFSEE